MAESGYGQFCPIAKAMEILGEKWTLERKVGQRVANAKSNKQNQGGTEVVCIERKNSEHRGKRSRQQHDTGWKTVTEVTAARHS